MPDSYVIPVWIQSALEALNKRTGSFSEREVVYGLGNAQRAAEIADSDLGEAFFAEHAAFAVISPRNPATSPWPTHFQPIAIMPTETPGEMRVTPDIKRGGADRINYWKSRVAAASHPVLKARYADLVWDMASFVGDVPRDAGLAATAIDAYLAAIRLEKGEFSIDALDRLSRALELALSTRDDSRTPQAVEAFFEYHRTIYEPFKIGTWAFLYDNLLPIKGGPRLEPKLVAEIAAMLEDVLGKALQASPPAGFVAEAASQRLAALYERRQEHEKRKDVLRRFATGCETVAGIAPSAMEAVHWLEKAHASCQQVGLREDAARIRVRLETVGKRMRDEMQTLTYEQKITKQELDAYLEAMTKGGLEVALQRFTQRNLPVRAKLVQELEEDQKAFLSQSLFGHRSIVDSAGYVIARIGTLQSDPENKIAHAIAERVGHVELFRRLVIDEIRKRYSPTPDDLLGQLKKSPVFAEDQDFLLREGLQAYLAEDHVKCIHVLAPQFEVALRTLAALLGLPTITAASRGVADVFQARTLTDLLDDPAIQEVLGPDMHPYLNSMLATASGLNLRNRVCHGLCEPQAFSRGHADIVVHCLLALSMIRGRERTEIAGTNDSQ